MSVSIQSQVVFVLGAPFSGRSTQCQRIAQEFNYQHISVSDLFKSHVKNETKYGKIISQFLEKNELVPEELTLQILNETIDPKKKTLLDGFPKNLEQALKFEKQFGIISQVIYLECDSKVLNERSQNQEGFEQRIQLFEENVQQILNHYKILNKIYIINANNSVDQVQLEFQKALSPNMIFFFGAPNTGKKTIAKYLAEKINYHYVNFEQLFQNGNYENDTLKVNAFINYIKNSNEKFFVFDSMFLCTKLFKIVCEFFSAPMKLFYLEAGKDQIEELIRKNTKDKKERDQKMQQYNDFLKNHQPLLQLLEKESYYSVINVENKSILEIQKEIMVMIHPQILISHEGTNKELQKQYLEKLCQNGYMNLNIPQLIELEKCENNFKNKLKLIRKIIFRQPNLYKFILSDFSDNLEDYLEIEKRVGFMITYQGNDEQQLEPQTHFYRQAKLIKVTEQTNDIFYLDFFIQKQAKYSIIMGPPFCGKTTLCKYLKEKFGYNLADFEKIIQQLKEKLGGEDGPLEDVPFDPLCKHLATMIKNQPDDNIILFDGWNYENKQLQQLFDTAGYPQKIVYLTQQRENITKCYKKKKEMEEGAELGEDDIKEIDNIVQKIKDNKEFLFKSIENTFYTQIYQYQIDGRLEKMLQDSQKIFQKRVFCVDVRNGDYEKFSNIFANICQKQNIHFIDVQQAIAQNDDLKTQLQDEYSMRWTYLNQNYPSNYNPKLVMDIIKQQAIKFKNLSRDIMIFGYPSADKNLQRNPNETYFPRITDEINQILQGLGPIRLLITVDSQLHNVDDMKYNDPVQEKVVQVVEEKKKILVEGEEEQQEEKVEEDGEQQQKKWNHEDYSWTQSDGNSKNVLKIYSKLLESNEFQNISINYQNDDEILNQIQIVTRQLSDGNENGFLIQIQDN